MSDSAQPIAGWYPDPENAAAERWWDGAAWSDHRRPSTVAPAPPVPTTYAPAPTYAPPSVPGAPGSSSTYGVPAYIPAQPANSLAVVGLVLALGGLLISFGGLTSLAGGVISTVALVRAGRMRAQGLGSHRFGMALAGVICGYAICVLDVVATIVLLTVLAHSDSFGPITGTSYS